MHQDRRVILLASLVTVGIIATDFVILNRPKNRPQEERSVATLPTPQPVWDPPSVAEPVADHRIPLDGAPTDVACAMAFSPDDSLLAVSFVHEGVFVFQNGARMSPEAIEHIGGRPIWRSRTIILDVESGDLVREFSNPAQLDDDRYTLSLPTLCFGPAGQRLGVLTHDALEVCDVASGRVTSLGNISLREHHPSAIAFGGTGRSILTMAGDEEFPAATVREWDTQSGREVLPCSFPLRWYTERRRSKTISPDGKLLAGGGWPGPTPRIWRTDVAQRITFCFRHPYHVCQAFTADCQRFATVHADGIFILWQIRPTGYENARQLLVCDGFDGTYLIALSNDDTTIACVQSDGSILLRSMAALALRALAADPAAEDNDAN